MGVGICGDETKKLSEGERGNLIDGGVIVREGVFVCAEAFGGLGVWVREVISDVNMELEDVLEERVFEVVVDIGEESNELGVAVSGLFGSTGGRGGLGGDFSGGVLLGDGLEDGICESFDDFFVIEIDVIFDDLADVIWRGHALRAWMLRV